ncbi:MAG: ribosome silencing factor [Acidimicrobiales bacterium]|nr:ribosome silencing factor [Acidimicrobiales bacterium]
MTTDVTPLLESPTADLVLAATHAALAKNGERTLVLFVGPVLALTDAFVITSAPNTRQVRTIVEEVERAVKASGGAGPARVEGLDDARWVLMDFEDFVVHVFLSETRSFYELERLWTDVQRLDCDEQDVDEVLVVGARP